jgi:non-heme chloroperoxidase
VVLLHGGGQTRHAWGTTARVLAEKGWRSYSVDLRGHGDSQWAPDGDYSLDAFANDVVAISRSLPRPPILVGASLGGIASLVAVTDAQVQADLAHALVLVDVAHRLEDDGRDRIGNFMRGNIDGFDSLDDAADVIAAYNPHRPRPTDLSGLAKNLRQRDDGRWYWHWDPEFLRIEDESHRRVDPDRMEAAAAALELPTLIVRGARSDVVSDEALAHMQSLVPHAEVVDVKAAGHMVAGDDNDVFAERLEDFVGAVRA